MSSLSRTKRLLLFVALVLMLPLLAACAGDDEDDATSTSDSPAVEVTTAPESTPDAEADTTPDMDITPDTDTTPDMDTTPDTDMTPETDMTPDADMTPESAGTPDMDSTPDADTTPDTDATPDTATTPDSDSTPGTGMTGPFGELDDLTADVPNFSLEFMAQFENVPDDTGSLFSADLDMMLAQSEPDVYHLQLTTTGDEALDVEVWSLPDATYLSESGDSAVELPAGLASEFAPTEALTVMPPVELLQNAEEVGEDEVNGRTATEYRVDAEDALMILMAQGQDVNVSNPEGEMNIWVDEELNVVIQMTADVTFEHEDGEEGSIVIDYMVTDIDETEDIEAPSGS